MTEQLLSLLWDAWERAVEEEEEDVEDDSVFEKYLWATDRAHFTLS